MGHSVGEAAARSTAKGTTKKVEDSISNEEKIRQIRLNLSAGLSISNSFIQGLLEEYDKEKAAVMHLGPAAASLLKRAEAAESKQVEEKPAPICFPPPHFSMVE